MPNFSRPLRGDNQFRAPTDYSQVPDSFLNRTGAYEHPVFLRTPQSHVPPGMAPYPPPGEARVDFGKMTYNPALIRDAGPDANRPPSPALDPTGVPPAPPPSPMSRPSSSSSSEPSASRPASSSSSSTASSSARSSTSSDHDPFYFDRPESGARFRAPSPSGNDASGGDASRNRVPLERPAKGTRTPRMEPPRGVRIENITTPTSESDPVGFALSRLNGEHLRAPTKSASVPIPRGPAGKPDPKRAETD